MNYCRTTIRLAVLLMLSTLGSTLLSGQISVDIVVAPGFFSEEMAWELTDAGGAVIASGACGTIFSITTTTVSLDSGMTYTFEALDDWGDGWDGGSYSIIKTLDGCKLAAGLPDNGLPGDGNAVCYGFDVEESVSFDPGAGIVGCTNPLAINFDPCATVDAGNCLLPAMNDDCTSAILIDAGTCLTGTDIGATFSGDSVSGCIDGDPDPLDIWFKAEVPPSGDLRIQFDAQPGVSGVVELYTGSCADLGAGILAGSGNCSNYLDGDQLDVLGLNPGDTLLVRYWDFDSDQSGELTLCLSEPGFGCTDPCASNYDSTATVDDGSCVGTPAAGGNDICASATLIASEGSLDFYTGGADGSTISSCGGGDSIDVWYRYTVPLELDSMKLYTCGSSFDTHLSVWLGCPDAGGSEIACNDDGVISGLGMEPSNCAGSLYQSAISLIGLDSLLGQTIYIRVSGTGGSSGCGSLELLTYEPPCSLLSAPQNPGHNHGDSKTTLFWDIIPNSVGCQAKGARITPPGPSPVLNIVGFEVPLIKVPYTKSGPGTEWQWLVRCACNLDPLLATPFSVADTFLVPVLRESVEVDRGIELYPNPAFDYLQVNSYGYEDSPQWVVTDMLGRAVASGNLSQGNLRIPVSDYVAGQYFFELKGEQARSFSVR